MESNNERHTLVLAVSPTARGFGFALFESPTEPIDWGVKEARHNKNAVCIDRLRELIEFYQPDILVVEDDDTPRKGGHARSFISAAVALASDMCVPTHRISRSMVRETFAQFGVVTKYQIAKKIVEWLPDLSPRLPRYRKPWMSEDYRMGIFDAVAAVLAYFYMVT